MGILNKPMESDLDNQDELEGHDAPSPESDTIESQSPSDSDLQQDTPAVDALQEESSDQTTELPTPDESTESEEGTAANVAQEDNATADLDAAQGNVEESAPPSIDHAQNVKTHLETLLKPRAAPDHDDEPVAKPKSGFDTSESEELGDEATAQDNNEEDLDGLSDTSDTSEANATDATGLEDQAETTNLGDTTDSPPAAASTDSNTETEQPNSTTNQSSASESFTPPGADHAQSSRYQHMADNHQEYNGVGATEEHFSSRLLSTNVNRRKIQKSEIAKTFSLKEQAMAKVHPKHYFEHNEHKDYVESYSSSSGRSVFNYDTFCLFDGDDFKNDARQAVKIAKLRGWDPISVWGHDRYIAEVTKHAGRANLTVHVVSGTDQYLSKDVINFEAHEDYRFPDVNFPERDESRASSSASSPPVVLREEHEPEDPKATASRIIEEAKRHSIIITKPTDQDRYYMSTSSQAVMAKLEAKPDKTPLEQKLLNDLSSLGGLESIVTRKQGDVQTCKLDDGVSMVQSM
ncbi:hypothetical protein [Aliagarivorans taiwanensis]|uniref:hypothetical protein n=1 Tax=Aliagarivorans taiwanensis TaxID=561966 RepID=UPI00040C0E1C|nr:hypothetical protein [Aliagarivorans taiwanensis]